MSRAPRAPRYDLIAVEGARAAEVAALARRLSEQNGRCAITSWDASRIFHEMSLADPDAPGPSPRTLLLLYASDLVFRLQKSILPAKEDRLPVIAAPYVQTAMAFGLAAGLSRRWLVDLFRFAPRARVSYHAPGSPASGTRGFVEFCLTAISADLQAFNTKIAAYLEKRGLKSIE